MIVKILLTVSKPFTCLITLSEIVSTILLFFAGAVTVPRTNKPPSNQAAAISQAGPDPARRGAKRRREEKEG